MNRNSAHFGVGCFHFGIQKDIPFKITMADYFDNLRAALNSITTVTDINIDSEDEYQDHEMYIEEEVDPINKGQGYFPDLSYASITFKISVPERVQIETLKKVNLEYTPTAENFKVSLLYGWHMPVCIAELINPIDATNPSAAIVMLREFINREFTKEDKEIRFEFIGPSPFHADFHISFSKEVKELSYTCKINRTQYGYDKIVYKAAGNRNLIVDMINEEIRNELGVYYQLIQYENYMMFGWEEVQQSMERLLSLNTTTGYLNRIIRIIRQSKVIHEVINRLAQYETDVIYDKYFSNRSIKEIYDKPGQKSFRLYIDEVLNGKLMYPSKEIKSLVMFYEDRRFKSREIFTILLSGLLGGSLGYILSVLSMSG